MEVLFGGISSLLYGVADFLGGEGAKRVSAASVVLWAGTLSFPVLLVVALVFGGEAVGQDYLLGALAGVMGGLGLIILFAGLSRGHAAAVAPVAAAVGAVVPVVAALIEGESPSTLSWLGVVIAVPAIMLCAWVVDRGDVPGGGWLFGLAAGLGFGGFSVLIRLTSESSNLLPLIASRAATVMVPLALAGLGVWQVDRFNRTPRSLIGANALLDVSGNVALLFALRAGSLASGAVAASFYPAITVIMARFINDEHLSKRQILGLVLAVISMAAIALG
ncbi:MAG TPA: EamA family transporter [Acidimicrobiia bacterium]